MNALDFTWGTDCGVVIDGFGVSEWCTYQEPHRHGFACDSSCLCKTDEIRWRWGGNPPNVGATPPRAEGRPNTESDVGSGYNGYTLADEDGNYDGIPKYREGTATAKPTQKGIAP